MMTTLNAADVNDSAAGCPGSPSAPAIIAAFDFDGTITRRDSVGPFLLSVVGWRQLVHALVPVGLALIAFWLHLVPAARTKERLFRQLLAGSPAPMFRARAERFAAENLPQLVRRNALDRLRWHQRQGHRCIVVTASLEEYVRPWATSVGIEDVAGSRLEVSAEGRLTGRLSGPHCDGPEKAHRARELAAGHGAAIVYAYGDSRGDRELLACAEHAYYRTMPASQP
jgi:HAD superfamily hydrolase (TIGR01490 family)